MSNKVDATHRSTQTVQCQGCVQSRQTSASDWDGYRRRPLQRTVAQ